MSSHTVIERSRPNMPNMDPAERFVRSRVVLIGDLVTADGPEAMRQALIPIVRAAMEAERERCKQVALRFEGAQPGSPHALPRQAREIAAAIASGK
jgi:hypothetical protein